LVPALRLPRKLYHYFLLAIFPTRAYHQNNDQPKKPLAHFPSDVERGFHPID
jgi:hypothetical protein